MLQLPPYRYIKDRSVSDYTYSEHADGYSDCLEDMIILLSEQGIPFRLPRPCTKEDLRVAGRLDDDD